MFIHFNWFSLPVASLQAGKILAHPQHSHQDHRELGGRPGKPDAGTGHHRLHLRSGGHAAVWQELPRLRVQDLLRLPAASMAHEGLLPLLPHCVPRAVRRMDRDHVGLYGGCRAATVHPGLHVGHGHREPGGECQIGHFYMLLNLCWRPSSIIF